MIAMAQGLWLGRGRQEGLRVKTGPSDLKRIEVVDDEMARILRGKTGAERLAMANDMFNSARRMLLSHLAAEHPDWSEEEIARETLEYYREGGSDKHLRDIAGVLKISGRDIDRGYVEEWARELGLEEIWQDILPREEDL
jgi:hypothetical protein